MTKKVKDKKAEPPPPERKESMDAAVKRSVLVVDAENEVRGTVLCVGRKIRGALRTFCGTSKETSTGPFQQHTLLNPA